MKTFKLTTLLLIVFLSSLCNGADFTVLDGVLNLTWTYEAGIAGYEIDVLDSGGKLIFTAKPELDYWNWNYVKDRTFNLTGQTIEICVWSFITYADSNGKMAKKYSMDCSPITVELLPSDLSAPTGTSVQ